MRRQPSLRAVRALGAGTLGVAILATGASAVAQATDSHQDTGIQVKLADRQLALGQQVVATGTVAGAPAGSPVALEFRPRSGGGWRGVASATTAEGGAFRLAGKVDRSGLVRVIRGAGSARAATASTAATGGASPEQRVDVHAKLASSIAPGTSAAR